ncbi:MAG TPA: biosynthetic-type acetolactate synthase large subunit [Nitrospirales bacterium]|nr:biosynthetic-type acetolactate synthase large subunit [Nitrospirales bacterium]HIA13436.1 biosynthetic-type acetolactate synthase large subunit [Nitrospirales bacterium]HIC04360.1 biosynthetic-type acetolactate synthase large subunit [Nitrospirales bacterium]HIN33735.1 biosynthetic-type acetolactate synthase large subunit [Nitrospirales bacterium]
MMLNGSQIFIESLKREGVDVIFGLPGGVVLKIFDALHQQSDVKVVLTRHEQGAGHMAEGYAKATGRPGVALVTSGPGMTNIVTPLADAYMDSVPIVVFTGQVPTQLIGNDAFQEADNIGISRPCTKHNFLVRDVKDLARTIREAFHIATTGRPGPVLVDIPKDVSINTAEFDYPETVNLRGYDPDPGDDKTLITRAAEAICQAKRPIIYVGGGAVFSNAADEVKALAEIAHIPVDMTLMGLGVFPASHPLSLGMLGMHGSYTANMAIHNADLVIAVGSRFDDRVTGKTSEFCPKAKIIHIDIDPTSIRKIRDIEVHIPILGDVKAVLTELTQALKVSIDGNKKDLREPWWNQLHEWTEQHPLTYSQSDDEAIKPQYVIDRLYQLTTEKDPIVATDVGQHQMWAAQYFKLEHPRRWLTSGGLGTMGFGFPAAMGAQEAYPGRLVLCVTGDGSFQMNLQELATAVLYKLPVKIVIINNHYHGMVRQWQDLFYEGRYASSHLSGLPDYVKLAEAYGAVGLRATSPSDVDQVIQEALHTDGPVLMDFEVSRSENVYPMIPAGGANHEMLLEDPPHLGQAATSSVEAPETVTLS